MTGMIKIHKRVIILHLTAHPEDLKQIFPACAMSAEEVIEFLRCDPREWMDEFSQGAAD